MPIDNIKTSSDNWLAARKLLAVTGMLLEYFYGQLACR
jgi:hypothetical protein